MAMRYFIFCLVLVACSSPSLPVESIDAGAEAQTVVAPRGKPWVWYAPTIATAGLPDAHDQWLIARWAAVGIVTKGVDVGESYGSPAGRALFTDFYNKTVAEGFSATPCFYLRSRGGLQGYDWLSEHPSSAACIAGIYP